MPEYTHQCQNAECNYEWEAEYSIKDDPPTECPKCHQQTAKRLISLCGKGVVELYGQDLVDKCKQDAKDLQRQANNSEKVYSNLLGENTYNNLQKKLDKRKYNR